MSTTTSTRRGVSAAILLGAALSLTAGLGLGEAHAGISRDKVLVVGIDGLRYDKLVAARAPNLKRLTARGTLSPTTRHLHGGESREYARSIEVDDRQVGRLLRAIRSRPTYRRERWTVIVTTDHGHTARGGHGGSEQPARTSLILAAGPGLPAGRPRVQPRNVDVASTVFRSLGVKASPDWGLDGRPLGKASSDPFDTTAAGRVPAGWRVDNRRMGTGGVREWRSWRFTTDARWTRAGRDEQRENFVRSRGVIAVADPDLSGGTFDSTLTSASYRVGGAKRIAISFGAHYRQGGSQRGRVSVSFDGGRPRAVLDYGPAPGARTANRGRDVISKRQSARLDVPRGARELRLHFRLYDARGGGYWAIDEPRVKPVP